MSEYIQQNIESLRHLLPEGILLAGFIIALLADLFRAPRKMIWFAVFAVQILALYVEFMQGSASSSLFSGLFAINEYNAFAKLIFLAIAPVYLLIMYGQEDEPSEYIYLFPIFIVSLNMLVMANHIMSIFVCMEWVSLMSYTYIGIRIAQSERAEATVKYILFGLMSAAVMLFGASLLYGLTGTLGLDNRFLSQLSKAPVVWSGIAIVFFLAGFLFKLSAVPFHYYLPDMMQGSKPRTLSFIGILPKIAAFVVLLNFMHAFSFNWRGTVLIWPNFEWQKVWSIIAIFTLLLANLSALSQSNIKRILAYSSISHTGFMLLGVISFSNAGIQALLYYSSISIISTIALFLLVDFWEKAYGIRELKQLSGFYVLHPWLSFLLVILLASLTGLPPFAGFTAKLWLFSALLESYQISGDPWQLGTLVAAVLSTVLSLYYYFNFLKSIYLRPAEQYKTTGISFGSFGLIALLCLSLILFGIFPNLIMR